MDNGANTYGRQSAGVYCYSTSVDDDDEIDSAVIRALVGISGGDVRVVWQSPL